MKNKLKELLKEKNKILILFLKLNFVFTYLYFIYEIWKLDFDPNSNFFRNFPLGIFLISIFNIFIYFFVISSKTNYKKIIYISFFILPIFCIVNFISIYTSIPTKQNYFESIKKAEEDKKEVKKILQYEDKKEQNYQKPPIKNDDKKEISTDKEKNIKKEVEDIQKNNKNINNEEIIKKVTKTVPVEQNKWNCNENGCAFGDGNIIWTFENSARQLNVFLLLLNLSAIIFCTIRIENTQTTKSKNKK